MTTVWLFIGAAYLLFAVLFTWGLCRAAGRDYPKPPGSRTPVRGPGLDPGGGDDRPVPRREPAAGPLGQFADDVRATLGHPPSTGPGPYDYYKQRHPDRPVADPDPRAVRQRDPNLRDGPAHT